MSAAQNKEASVKFPVASSDATGKNVIYGYASSTSTTVVQLPAEMVGRFLYVASIGCDTQVAITYGATQILTYNQASTIASPQGGRGLTIPAGQYIDRLVVKPTSPVTPVYLSFISSATGGQVEFYSSELASV